ncbi:predicted MFS family arabinose efflux permease [Bacillus oleivorans]|uniref:Predicted MFS family arabinose efflux permease n=1 Tax=Bacillus oleivorans TaxID=1448271 RepID=A0A285CY54_9BACI|nr:MFS transporter [Bacillus oleivorans]SNX72504.1 predicted MFS family arabinose efflux permease [Bacillus oleivorans]
MESKENPDNSRVIVVVAIVTSLSLLGDSMLYIALPLYWEEAGLDSIWQVGILLSINRFVRLPFNPFVGWIYKRISLRFGLIIAVILGGLTTLGYGLFEGFIAWVILRGLWGIAWSLFRIGGLSAVAFLADEKHRGQSMGLYNGLYRLGSLAGMLIGGILVPFIGLSIVSIIFGVITFTGLPLIMYFLKTKERPLKAEKVSALDKAIFSQSTFKYKVSIITTGFFITLLYQGVFTSTISLVVEHVHGKSISIFGSVLSATLLTGIILSARWVWEPSLGKLFGRWSDGPGGRHTIFIHSLIFAGITFGLISSNLTITVWVLITFLVMIGSTSITTVMDAIALDTAKTTNIVSFLTIYSIAQDVGAALGPFISYMILELKLGFTYLYWGGAGIFIFLAILWSIIHASEKKIKYKVGESVIF